MKKIICEACGSNELVRKGNYFICEYCRSTYEINKVMTDKRNTLHSSPKQSVKLNEDKSSLDQKEVLAKNEPKKVDLANRTPFLFRLLGNALIIWGILFALVVITSLVDKEWLDVIFFGLWSTLLINGGNDLVNTKRTGIIRKLRVPQLIFLIILSLILFFCYVNGFLFFKYI
ncbi:hypothetical protein [Enterococcus sp. AZ192]|uniref:hypothetical protein n=1 Tax=unclassified Enterococcus TaxID=2608891 RepID=UPI003D2E4C19